jgi:sporulation protein YlmC with PRC-barrel domain
MKPEGPLKLVSQLIDLPILDKDERWCGIVDDIEFSGGAAKEMRVKALLVGPGAYEGRLPGWLFWLVRKLVGDRMVRVPVAEILEIGSALKLKSTAAELKLHTVEEKARNLVPHWGAL